MKKKRAYKVNVTYEGVLKKFLEYKKSQAKGSKILKATIDWYKPSKQLSEKKRKYFYLRFTNAPEIKYDLETNEFKEIF
ncbi:MAG TPA: hypothetical protein VFV08_04770 [Puia sp.]|nr:hypothetical protein [Puia sp.]